MLNRAANLLANRIIHQLNHDHYGIQLDSEQFAEELSNGVENGIATLPIHPGFEKHPYKGVLENSSASKYIIGTFPPISYLIDSLNAAGSQIQNLRQPTFPFQLISKPNIPFFHGNVNGLWGVLLPQNNLAELIELQNHNRLAAKNYLIHWLSDNNIFYDDIISFTQRKLGKIGANGNLGYTFEDVNLKNICPDLSLVQQLLNHSNLNVVCFTNGATFRSGQNGGLGLYDQINRIGMVKTKNADALSLFLRTCQDIGLQIEMRCLPHFNWTLLQLLNAVQKRTKLIFELRITRTSACTFEGLLDFNQKNFTAITPFSPAAHGNIEAHPIILSFRAIHGQIPIVQILNIIYEKFRTNTYGELYQYNIN